MKFINFLRSNTLGALAANMALVCCILSLVGVTYFYLYLPGVTNHGESTTVPDLTGLTVNDLEEILSVNKLRYEISDSAYSEDYTPTMVLRQFPKPGAVVKQNRVIYVSINQVSPPTVPLPALVDGSATNAEELLTSNHLKLGSIHRIASPFHDLVIEMRYQGKKIEAGQRVPRGSVIDLVVGDGEGSVDHSTENAQTSARTKNGKHA